VLRVALAALVLVAGCSKPPDGSPDPVPPVVSVRPAAKPSAQPEPAPASPPEVILDDQPLRAGRVVFSGMVRPVKGGYEVRGVVVGDELPKRLAASSVDGVPADPDWFLGAVVRVTGEVTEHANEPAKGGLAEQGREGAWFEVDELETAELVAPAVVIEGKVSPSKGLMQVDKYMVNRDDLAWSLAASGGGKAGDRVRLWGQPRVHVCDPRAQCLEGGSIPLFAIGRALKIP
jgi:hypothetical protein